MRVALPSAALTLVVATAAAQSGGRTLQQVEQRFLGMSEIHIAKCDHNGDGLYDGAELACVNSLYLATVGND